MYVIIPSQPKRLHPTKVISMPIRKDCLSKAVQNIKVYKTKTYIKKVKKQNKAEREAFDKLRREGKGTSGSIRTYGSLIRNLEEKQQQALRLLTDFHHVYSMAEIAALIGVSPPTLAKWRSDPIFNSLLNDEISKHRTTMRLEAFRAWFRAIKRGDTKVIKDYFKMTGDLREELDLNVKDMSAQTEEELAAEIKRMEAQLGEHSASRRH